MRSTIAKITATAILGASLLLPACASQSGYQGATAGAAVGGIAGALLEPRNPWRGAVIGGALGATFGGAMGEISNQNRYYQQPQYQRPYYRGY